MLEGVREWIELGLGHPELASELAPRRYGRLHLAQNLMRARTGDPEVRGHREQRLDRGLGSGFLGDPGLELAHAVGEGIQVEGGCEAPLAAVDVQEAVVAQVV